MKRILPIPGLLSVIIAMMRYTTYRPKAKDVGSMKRLPKHDPGANAGSRPKKKLMQRP